MDHSIYESWKTLENVTISNNGEFIFYEINPQQGDGILCIYRVSDGFRDTIQRGYNAHFVGYTPFLAGKIKPPYLLTRAAKKEKMKKDEMPKDSLFIYNLQKEKVEKIADVTSFKIGKEEGNWIVYHHYPRKEEKDTTQEKETRNQFASIASKFNLADLVLFNPSENRSIRFENVASYEIGKMGDLIVFQQIAEDTLINSVVYAFDTKDENSSVIFNELGFIERITVSDTGSKTAFLHHSDSAAVSGYNLHYWEKDFKNSIILIDSTGLINHDGMGVSKYGKLFFSGKGDRLFFGRKEIPEEVPEDTLLDSEKPSVDVWSWTDQLLQPMQKKQLKKDKEKTFLTYINLKNNNIITLENEEVDEVRTMPDANGDYMLGLDFGKYDTALSWEGVRYSDIWLIRAETGERKMIRERHPSRVYLSPLGKYIVYYDPDRRQWYSYENSSGNILSLTENIPNPFYDEETDIPTWPQPYGLEGFTRKDEFVLIRDRYDLWKIDPSGKIEPENLTRGFGRNNQLRLRLIKFDPEEEFMDLEQAMYFFAQDEETKETGIGRVFPEIQSVPKMLVYGNHFYSNLEKARDKPVFLYTMSDFQSYGNLHLAGQMLSDPKQISDVNPQAENYLWGKVELVSWRSFDGKNLQGLLYTPENLDPDKKYPMLVYFYEQSSDRLYQHTIPSPSRSIINIPWCTSNGYLVFVPDIVYREGFPGQSAYDAIVSGTQSLLERYSFVDEDKIGLQGQSWGGYQVAWLVTRTNMFRAAMAGAPVSNMTSAYGGIRWGTGMSRMFQYERTQSRIGGTLWDRKDLYIENSPLFRVPSVETPLLIMHNDNDGAVPWYQGIEFFVALRRLGKPAWMLTYNNEEHNLRKWPNRIDLSIRMMQFFDHYLKDEPMPDWMKNGIPQLEKGNADGRKLLNSNNLTQDNTDN